MIPKSSSMNLHQLRLFSTVARLGSFSRAAEELHISQPSVSIQVADLERALGVDLFEQLGKRIYLTEPGRILDEYAHRILSLADEAETALAEVRGLRRGRIVVGAATTPGTYLLPQVIRRYQDRFPQVAVALEIGATARIQERVLRGELDLGVVGAGADDPHLAIEPWLDDELVIVAAPSHPLARMGGVNARGLLEHRVILREQGSATRDTVERALRDAGLMLTPAMELGSSEAIKEAVAAGLGVAILSQMAVRVDIDAGRLVMIPTPDLVIRRRFYVAVHRQKRRSEALRSFLEMLHASTGVPAS
jgi:DNA-binding transcriptional LysR family regulator